MCTTRLTFELNNFKSLHFEIDVTWWIAKRQHRNRVPCPVVRQHLVLWWNRWIHNAVSASCPGRFHNLCISKADSFVASFSSVHCKNCHSAELHCCKVNDYDHNSIVVPFFLRMFSNAREHQVQSVMFPCKCHVSVCSEPTCVCVWF